MTNSVTRLLSLTMRVLALGSRFLLFIVLAIYLPSEQVGLFGLFAATIGFSIFLMGMDFYVYANRELRVSGPEKHSEIIKHSLVLYAYVYSVILPVLVLIFITGFLPWNLALLFFLILVFEHLGQESYRLFIILGRPLLASASLFLRLGLWAITISGLMVLSPTFRTLEAVFIAWAIGGGVTVALGAWVVAGLPRGGWKKPVDSAWIRIGLRTALAFLAASLCLRGIVTVDRFWLEALTSREILGAYVFFMGMASALPALLEAGVFAFILPDLITKWHDENYDDYTLLFKRLIRETLIAVLGFCLVAVIGIRLVLSLVDNPVYSDNIALFYLALVAVAGNALSMIFHIGLYSKHRDKSIIASHFFGLTVFIGTTYWFTCYSDYYAVPIGVLLAYFSILGCKAVLFSGGT